MAKNIETEINTEDQGSRTRHTMPAPLRVLLSIVFMIPMSVLFAWILEWRCRLNDVDATWEWASSSYLVFWYSCVIMFLIMSVIVSLTWRLFFGTGLTFALVCIISFIDAEKYKLRATPLLPEDFQMAGNAGEVASFVDPWAIVWLVVGVVFILIGSGVLEYCVRKTWGRSTKGLPLWQRWSLIPRATFTLLSATCLMLVSRFTLHYSDANQKIDWLDTQFIAWNQDINYDDNGFIIAFLYNIGKSDLPEPDGYNEATIAEIKARYESMVAEDVERKDWSDVVDNVIVVLDETFYDLELFDEYYAHTGKDLLPNLHKIFKQYPSGYMYSPEYGGNTANIEFEVLTGLSNYWSQTMPYTSVVSKVDGFPSNISMIKNHEFDTTAIHAFDGSVYKRNIVYKHLGYNEFIDRDAMKYQDLENNHGYIADSSLYREALDIIKESDESQLIGLVTMQNHSPYNFAWYWDFGFQIIDHADNYLLQSNFQSLHMADKYLGEFIKELDKLDERTVVLWFGDHAAGLLDQYINSDEKSERDLAHLTPYFIYANFDIESTHTAAEVAKTNEQLGIEVPTVGVDLPTTTPNCLMNTMYNILDVKKSPISYLLDGVCEVEPILAQVFLEGRDLQAEQAVKDYEMLNYDLLNGEKYWLNL